MTPTQNPPVPAAHTIPDACAILTVTQMYGADKAAADAGISTLSLMEAAGAAVARAVVTHAAMRPVVVLCGPGNNGGDGFVAARLLTGMGWSVEVALLGSADELKGDAAVNARRWQALGAIAPVGVEILRDDPLVIDALFGAGLARPLEGAARDVIDAINARKISCIAVDVPSGVHGDTGDVLGGEAQGGTAPRCVATVTFFRPKPAHYLYPARDLCGDVTVADIGIPASVLAAIAPKTAHNTPALWQLPQRTWRDHKFDHGYAIIVGGGLMTGASRLAARAVRRAGAGLLRIAVPLSVVALYAADAPGAFVQGLETEKDLEDILADPRRNGVLIGPGAGVGTLTRARVLTILDSGKAVVLDADALTSFEEHPDTLLTAIGRARGPVILTPHDGEFGRVFKDMRGSRLARARDAAAASGAIIVLKGADTVVAAPDGRAGIASNAPPLASHRRVWRRACGLYFRPSGPGNAPLGGGLRRGLASRRNRPESGPGADRRGPSRGPARGPRRLLGVTRPQD